MAYSFRPGGVIWKDRCFWRPRGGSVFNGSVAYIRGVGSNQSVGASNPWALPVTLIRDTQAGEGPTRRPPRLRTCQNSSLPEDHAGKMDRLGNPGGDAARWQADESTNWRARAAQVAAAFVKPGPRSRLLLEEMLLTHARARAYFR